MSICPKCKAPTVFEPDHDTLSQGYFGEHTFAPELLLGTASPGVEFLTKTTRQRIAAFEARIQQLEGENAALREALTEAHARMVYLFQALPFEQRHRWGGDVAEFIEGIDAGRGEQQAP